MGTSFGKFGPDDEGSWAWEQKQRELAAQKEAALQTLNNTRIDGKGGNHMYKGHGGILVKGVDWAIQKLQELSQERKNTLNPLSYTDDALRLVGGGLRNVAETAEHLKTSALDPYEQDWGKRVVGTGLHIGDEFSKRAGATLQGTLAGGTVHNPVTGTPVAEWKGLGFNPTATNTVGQIVGGALLEGGAGRLLKGARGLTIGGGPPLNPAFAAVRTGDGLMIRPPVTEFKPSSVFQVAGNMEAAGWQGPIKSMLKSKVPSEQIAARMAKPYHGALKKGYISMTLEDLAKDKGGWLTRLIGRADDYAQGLRDWRVAKCQGTGSEGLARIQRQFSDNLTENPLDAFKQIYDPNNPIRKLLQKGFNTFAGKEWHHIFGNKDAAEFMLSTVAQDPYIAVNLFHFMKKLKLSTSGTPDNIALMSMKPHRGKGGWHSYSKGLGLEGKGKKAGDAAFSEWAQAVSKGILDGSTDVNEIFSLLEVYSRLNKAQRDLLKTNYGAKIVSEQGPIMQYIQGVARKSPDQVLQ